MRISGGAATLAAVTAACGAVTYYVHMLQVEEKKEMRKYVDAEIPRKRPTVSGVREELRNMKTTELVKRARRDGVSPETIDDALDADAPREALAEVLLAHWDLDDEGGEPDEWPWWA